MRASKTLFHIRSAAPEIHYSCAPRPKRSVLIIPFRRPLDGWAAFTGVPPWSSCAPQLATSVSVKMKHKKKIQLAASFCEDAVGRLKRFHFSGRGNQLEPTVDGDGTDMKFHHSGSRSSATFASQNLGNLMKVQTLQNQIHIRFSNIY